MKSRRLLFVLAAVAVTIVAGVASSDSAATQPFAITKLVVPLFVKQNGAKGTRAVYWQGSPVFPVTVHERGLCPEAVNCGPRTALGWGAGASAQAFPTRKNPLVNRAFYFCSGSLTSNYVIGVEDWLTDARGHKTAPVRSFWECKTH